MTSGAMAPGAALAIEVLGLERSFGSTVVLDGVDLAHPVGLGQGSSRYVRWYFGRTASRRSGPVPGTPATLS